MPLTKKQLALVHVAKAKCGLSDDEYRDLLSGLGVSSSKDLSPAGFEAIKRHFAVLGFLPTKNFKRPPESKKRLMAKIGAIRSELGLPEAYVDGMVQRMFKSPDGVPIASHRWLTADQLHRLVAALTYHQRRVQGRSK